ncbi:hypothetical protein OTK59_21655 [Vibrio natriegens]|uniref:hypothetical protein n=1 Tax=Vibrio natriegens TaxID=691 RepID=UPI00031E48AF|nr:hypothetical protein [Vibrio natriegens]MCY9879166.1 hypothetical protein [Vibrio natriegens]
MIKLAENHEKPNVLNNSVEDNTTIQMSKKEKGTFYITNDGGLIFGGQGKAGLYKVKLDLTKDASNV